MSVSVPLPSPDPLGAAYFLAGDSFPRQQHVEDAVRRRLAPHCAAWSGQQAILDRTQDRRTTGQAAMTCDIDQRVAGLRTLIPNAGAARTSVLIGRSSGARVAAAFACRYGAAAVICFGYPFREPARLIDPARLAPIAKVAVPALIIQGVGDPYGGLNITADYALSPAVSVHFLATDHEFHLADTEWDRVATLCTTFCRQAIRRQKVRTSWFDEAFYLGAHPDVAAAVKAGALASGEAHFRRHGQAERRSFRLLAPGRNRPGS